MVIVGQVTDEYRKEPLSKRLKMAGKWGLLGVVPAKMGLRITAWTAAEKT